MDKNANLTHRGTPYKKGQSGNPTGKPHRMFTLVTMALRERLAQPLSRESKITWAERLAEVLIDCVFHPDPELDKTRILAWTEIVDRCEGKAKQQLEINDVTSELRSRSDEDLMYYMQHGHWPEDAIVDGTVQ